jgi:nicotinamidase/pyrazinamidase
MKNAITLLIIDPQNDFCDVPEAYRPLDPLTGALIAPALPVAGAHADMQRLAALIREGGAGLTDIALTIDSHHRYDIAHPTFWQRGGGGPVSAFTTITAAQVRAGEFKPRDANATARTLTYLDALEAAHRYTLMVWPVHCEIGSWGNNIHADVRAATSAWEDARHRVAAKVIKGTNPWTEHYSAVQAEVPDATDPDTQLNRALINRLGMADLLVIAGEASSHCVRATIEHIVANLPEEQVRRMVLLTDCMSPVHGFAAAQADFFAAMTARGVRLATSTELLPQLRENA